MIMHIQEWTIQSKEVFRTLTSDNMDTWKAEKRSKVRRKSSQKKVGSLERRYTRAKCLESHESMIRSSGESKSRLAKAAGAELAAQHNNEKFHAAVARSTFSSQNAKKLTVPDPFLKFRSRKWHTAVARSTFASQNCKKMPVSDHFLKFQCRKIAHCCGAKHISKYLCTKYLRCGTLLEVSMSQRCPAQEIDFDTQSSVSQLINQSVGQSIS